MNCKFLSIWMIALASFALFGCSGGGGGGANSGTMTLATSTSTVTQGASLSATATITLPTTGTQTPLNNLNVTFSSNFPSSQGELIHFATYAASNVGNSTISVPTNASGIAFVVLNVDNTVSLPAAGVDVTISATCSGVSSAVATIHVNPVTAGGGGGSVVPKISISLSNSSIVSDTGQSIATATVTDQSNNPLAGKTVSFTQSPTGVVITPINSGTTDSSGKAYAILMANHVTVQTTVFITAAVDGILITTQLTITPVGGGGGSSGPAAINISIDNTILQGGQNALATATVTDTNGNPVSGQLIDFTTQTSSTITIVTTGSVPTDSKGKASAIIQAINPTASTYGIVLATIHGTTLSVSESVQVNPAPAAGKPQISLTLNPATVDPTVKQVIATAKLLDSTGTPVSGVQVNFSIISGAASIQAGLDAVTTGADGTATSIIIPGSPPSAQNVMVAINLIYPGTGTPYSLVATFLEQPDLNMTLSFNPTSVNTGGQVVATATLTTAAGAPVPNQPVTFNVINGAATLVGQSAATDVNGKVQAVFAPTNTSSVSNALISATTTYNTVSYTAVGSFQVNVSNIALSLTANDISGGTGQQVTVNGLTSGLNIKATLAYLDGTPIPGQTISFLTLDPTALSWSGSPNPSITAVTSTSGVALAVAVPGTFPSDGYVYIQASATVDGQLYTQTLPIQVLKSTMNFGFTLNPTTVTGNPSGSNTVVGTVTLTDSNGNPLANQTVTFSVISGPATLGKLTATTDGNGTATVTLLPNATLTAAATVLVEASTTVNGLTFSRVTQFTINPLVTLNLVTDPARIDANNGQVLATATVLDSAGVPLQGQTVTFSILAGPASFSGSATATTTSSGTANAIILPGNTTSTTNVLVQAQVTINGQTYSQVTSFQIVRGTGIITLSVNPSSTANIAAYQGAFTFLHQIPFTLTDSNGNPRPNVPVTLSVFSQVGAAAAVTLGTQPVTTDATGKGVFNISVNLTNGTPGNTVSSSIVYEATTNDTNPIIAYGGESYTLTRALSSPTINPGTYSFTGRAVNATTTLTVSGGLSPYSVSTSNAGHITASISGSTITATLVSVNWSGSETITIVDSAGQTATATISFAPPALAVNPGSATVSISGGLPQTLNFTISGGVTPYSASSTDGHIVPTIAGANLQVIVGTGTTANTYNVTVTDSGGGSVVVPIIVNP
jgi:hypothetical protein